MEWVLQVVDEFDDAIGAVRLGWLGLHAEAGKYLGGGVAAAAAGTALASGYETSVLCASSVVFCVGTAVKYRGSRRAPRD